MVARASATEPEPLVLRTHIADIVDARNRAVERVAMLERENRALRRFALSRIEDAGRLLPGETKEQRLNYLLRAAGE